MTTAITKQGTSMAVTGAMSTNDVLRQVKLIQEIMTSVMVKDEHYGTIPGCNKPALYKPGAEKLGLVFRLRAICNPATDVKRTELDGGHREYEITTHIMNQAGEEVATGIGLCTTLESKYRYRNAADYELQDTEIPKDYRAKKAEYRAQGYGAKQVNGVWSWVKYKDGAKIENPDIADQYNTVLKMAHKRSHVAGIILATACSDIFAQDDVPPPSDEPPREDLKPPKAKQTIPPDEHRQPEAPDGFDQTPADPTLLRADVTLGTVSTKTEKNARGPWTRYYAQGDDGLWYQTFSETIGGQMRAASGKKTGIMYTVETGPKGESRTVISVLTDDDDLPY